MQQQAGRTWLERVRRALRFVRPYRGKVCAILAMTLAVAAFGTVEPLVMKYLFDELVAGGRRTLLIGVLALVGLGLGRELVSAASNWLTWRVRTGVHYGLLEATVTRPNSLPLAFHHANAVGGTMTRLERGITGFVAALTEIAFNVLPAVVYLAMAVVVMFRLDWRLSLVVLAFTPIPALIGAWAAGEQARRERTLLDQWMRIYSRFNEVLSGIVTVKSFTMEEEEKQRFLRDVDRANAVVIRGVGRDTGVGAAKNAAALLKDPPILVLDEATSALWMRSRKRWCRRRWRG